MGICFCKHRRRTARQIERIQADGISKGRRLLKALSLSLLMAAVLAPQPASAQTLTFGRQTISTQTYAINVRITPLQLPQATGGSGSISYTLQPTTPDGLRFDAASRTLSGTPSTAMATAAYTYTAVDASNTTANPALTFKLTVVPWIVSNLDEPGAGRTINDHSRIPYAMAFTTGNNSAGYLFKNVVFDLAGASNDAAIYSNSGTSPGVRLASLTGPEPSGAGHYTYTPTPGTNLTLAANTTYWAGINNALIGETRSNDERAFDGWQINNWDSRAYSSLVREWGRNIGRKIRFSITATPIPSPNVNLRVRVFLEGPLE